MGQPVVHFEIGCKDMAATSAFYAAAFGWTITPSGPAGMIETGSAEGVQGHLTALGHEPFQYTKFYVQVEDVAAALVEVQKLGGKMVVPPVTIPTGTFGWFSDPEGNTLGLWKPA